MIIISIDLIAPIYELLNIPSSLSFPFPLLFALHAVSHLIVAFIKYSCYKKNAYHMVNLCPISAGLLISLFRINRLCFLLSLNVTEQKRNPRISPYFQRFINNPSTRRSSFQLSFVKLLRGKFTNFWILKKMQTISREVLQQKKT